MTVRTRGNRGKEENDQREMELPVYRSASARSEDSEDDAPEAVSMAMSKTKVVSQIKAEREAQRQLRERRRVRNLKLEEQNKLKKQKELNLHGKTKDESPTESLAESTARAAPSHHGITLAPLPQEVIEEAFAPRSASLQFESECTDEDDDAYAAHLAERRALALKQKLISALPFQITEIGKHGISRITREEARSRVDLLQAHEARQLGSVRRIGAVSSRARKQPSHRRLVRTKKL